MGWNGGVSLAIWMGGVAVELDAARRARDPAVGSRGGSAQLYTAICEAFDRELVIDILCGASAGGINGALLAAVIERDRPLDVDVLREQWLEIGDFSTLLQPLSELQPPALMQGTLFFTQLVGLFNKLLEGSTTGPAQLPAKVLLDVQVTDVQGDEHWFVDSWHGEIYAREYRAPVRFRKAGDYTPGTLAAAARASASFPGAFEAQELNGTAAALAGFPNQRRWAIDGGVLENAPIRQAIELIPTRRATRPVKRFVCYVNADPEVPSPADQELPHPQVGDVITYAVSLPRKARMIDQLRALEDAAFRSGMDAPAGVELLSVGRGALQPAANALLPTYQRRRALLSLVDLLDAPRSRSGPAIAQEILDALGKPDLLPWIPSDLDPPGADEEWSWGIRAGQRVLQLQLDVLNGALSRSDDARDCDAVFRERPAIDAGIAELDAVYRDFINADNQIAIEVRLLSSNDTRAQALAALARLVPCLGCVVSRHVRAGTDAFRRALDSLSTEARAVAPAPAILFGTTKGDEYEHFLGLALSVEVIRRSFTDDLDIESAHALHVAQLSPTAATFLLTDDPMSADAKDWGPCTQEEKLTGIRLGHFAAFYRSSWRANDFMWGRLDGANHTVRLLIDAARARALEHNHREPWEPLAEALVPTGNDAGDADHRRLVWEALESHKRNATAPADGPSPGPPKAEDLRSELANALRGDLTSRERDSGRLTYVMCTRAVQYEVLRDELKYVSAQAAKDIKDGAELSSLNWQLKQGSIWGSIETLRGWRGKDSLPCKLGRDSRDEATSALAARTISHAGVVGVTMLTGNAPFTRIIQPVRAPLFAVQGVSARRPLDRVGVLVAYTAAAWYIASRFLTFPKPKVPRVPLGALWSATSLALWVSLLTVIGVTSLPTVRTIWSDHDDRKVKQGLWSLALLVTGGAVGLAWQWIHNGTAVALTGSGAQYAPPAWVLWLVAAAGGFHVSSQIESVSKALAWLHKPIKDLVSTTTMLVFIVGALLLGFTGWHVIFIQLDHWGLKTVVAGSAIAAPAVLGTYLFLSDSRHR